jgi:hypothetical protein
MTRFPSRSRKIDISVQGVARVLEKFRQITGAATGLGKSSLQNNNNIQTPSGGLG